MSDLDEWMARVGEMVGDDRRTMTVTEAAKVWTETKAQMAVLEPKLKTAADVLKKHFRAKGTTSFRKVGYAKTTYTALDTALARAALGDKAKDCEVPRDRETLSAL